LKLPTAAADHLNGLRYALGLCLDVIFDQFAGRGIKPNLTDARTNPPALIACA